MNLETNSLGFNKKPSETTVVSDGFLFKPIEFKLLLIRWYLYLFLL